MIHREGERVNGDGKIGVSDKISVFSDLNCLLSLLLVILTIMSTGLKQLSQFSSCNDKSIYIFLTVTINAMHYYQIK